MPAVFTVARPAAAPAPGPWGRALAAVAIVLLTLTASPPPLVAASALLDRVRNNESMAKALCDQFKAVNAAGESALGRATVERIARSENISAMDAEVLISYVIGLHCSDVR